MGLVAPLPNGNLGTISAASPEANGPVGGIVHNDWGLEMGNMKPALFGGEKTKSSQEFINDRKF